MITIPADFQKGSIFHVSEQLSTCEKIPAVEFSNVYAEFYINGNPIVQYSFEVREFLMTCHTWMITNREDCTGTNPI